MDKLNEIYTKLKEPIEFTKFDAVFIYLGLSFLFFNLTFK